MICQGRFLPFLHKTCPVSGMREKTMTFHSPKLGSNIVDNSRVLFEQQMMTHYSLLRRRSGWHLAGNVIAAIVLFSKFFAVCCCFSTVPPAFRSFRFGWAVLCSLGDLHSHEGVSPVSNEDCSKYRIMSPVRFVGRATVVPTPPWQIKEHKRVTLAGTKVSAFCRGFRRILREHGSA